ncbi:HET-domain-containing protein [Stipitochalara longipes BDJ]|nr:HET-domain-containing protein [Stipitochalara longipes BDJ]
MMLPFTYTPLRDGRSDLRLIYLIYDEPGTRVTCVMNIFTKPVHESYQALSYTWGDGTRKVPITVNDREILVTKNLEAALINIRFRASGERSEARLPLWIDAICINQEDSDERDAQVRRMKSIYEQAEMVLIWLGNFNEPTDEHFRRDIFGWNIDKVEENSAAMARSAMMLIVLLQKEADHTQSSEISENSIRLADYIHANNLQAWAQLARLFNRPWFERLWIIQELAVSRNAIVQWGNLQINWSILEKAAKFILRPGETVLLPDIRRLFPSLGAHRITQVALKLMYNFDTKNVLTILHNTQNTKCSDPRDRLYAIWGIVEDNEDIEIDYSIPVQQVYLNWVTKRLKRTESLDFLTACANSSRDGDLPSWVPDLRRPFGQDKLMWIASQEKANISQGQTHRNSALIGLEWYKHKPQLSEDGLRLNVWGKYLGKISNLTSVGDVATDLPDPTDLEARLRQIIADWEMTLSSPLREQGGSSTAPKGFTETLLRACYPWQWQHSDSDLIASYNIWMNNLDTRHLLMYYNKYESRLRSFERSLFPRVHGCQMISSEDGMIGIVAGNCRTQIDDELWLLCRGLTAFVMRRVNETDHRLISPCYLYDANHWADAPFFWKSMTLV